MSDDTQLITAQIDAETHAMLREMLEHGELSEIIRDVCQTVAHGEGWDRRMVIDNRIEAKQRKLRRAREERQRLETDIESMEADLADLREKRRTVKTEAERYVGALWSLEQSFRAGDVGHLWPAHPRVEGLADQYDKDAEEVFEDLKERNPDVPGYAFQQVMYAERTFEGLRESAVDTPVDHRNSGDRR
jgi:chromosome segregation ATPase